MMKRLIFILLVLLITGTSSAFAAKARSIDSNADSDFHAQHLTLHIGETFCHATGNYIKTRSQSNRNKVIGHLEQADIFQLLEIKDGYALIQIISSHKSSPDSWDSMKGWVDSDYIDCNCSFSEYINPKNDKLLTESGYSSILDFFYQVISEKWDEQRIANAGFETYDFPDNLYKSGFFYWDINSDGIEELFILRNNDAETDSVLAGYTLVNGYPYCFFSSWARSENYLLTDGRIYNTGSNGAAYCIHCIYDLVGTELILREGVLSSDYEGQKTTELLWFLVDKASGLSYEEKKLISETAAEQRISIYQSSIIHRFDNYTPFSEYIID